MNVGGSVKIFGIFAGERGEGIDTVEMLGLDAEFAYDPETITLFAE